MMIDATSRPYTGTMTECATSLALLRKPTSVADHMLHAWWALGAVADMAANDPKRAQHMAYARQHADRAEAAIPSMVNGRYAPAERIGRAKDEMQRLRSEVAHLTPKAAPRVVDRRWDVMEP